MIDKTRVAHLRQGSDRLDVIIDLNPKVMNIGISYRKSSVGRVK